MKRLVALALLSLLSGSGLWAQGSFERLRLDVQHYHVDVELVPENSYLKGLTRIRFQVLEDAVSIPFSLNSRISLIQITDVEGIVYSPSFDNLNSSRMLVRGDVAFKPGNDYELTFTFDGTLEAEDYAYLDDTPRSQKAVIDSDGALLLTEGLWFPSHELRLDPATFEVKVTVPLGYTVAAPGELLPIETVGISEAFTWKSEVPQSNFPVSVARYFRQTFEDAPIPLTLYAEEDYEDDFGPFAKELGDMLSFFLEEYGDLPALKGLNIVQVGNYLLPSSGALGTLLLESTVMKAGQAYNRELARRLALQWWAYALQIRGVEDVWLQEGFASYAALRYVETRHPDRFETELARLAVDALKYESRAPVAAGYSLGPGTAPYQSVVGAKGAWVLYMLRQLVGPEAFNSMLVDWYRQNAGRSVTTSEFIDLVNARTGEDYRWFFVQWLESTGVPEFKVDYTILKITAGGFRVRGQIRQDLELFRMPVDLLVETKGEPEEKRLRLSGKNTSFNIVTETLPVRIMLDPHGKILRDSERMQVNVHIALGEEYQEQGEFVSALREFEKAKDLDPRSSYAHYRMGETYFMQHSYSNAANSFRDSLNGDLKPPWVQTWTHIHLGKIYDILGQRERAKAEYTKAVNTRVEYNGAQQEAQKYLNEPFSKPRTLIN